MEKLGTLRAVFEYVNTEAGGIPGGSAPSDQTIVRDGDKYEFALDGLVFNIDNLGDVWESKVKLDFSIFPNGGEQKLLVGFPYSCRGTRQNPKYIPLAKDIGFPRLPVNKKFYYRIENTDEDVGHMIKGVALVLFGYPVLVEG